MPDTVNCQRCAAAVRFDEEDRGSEVYCPSCGAVVAVPLEATASPAVPAGAERTPPESPEPPHPEPAPAAPKRGRASIFGGEGHRAALGDVIRKVGCAACGHEVPVRLEDIGTTLYCPACGAGVEAGPTLGGRADQAPKTPRPLAAPLGSGIARGAQAPQSPGRARWLVAGGLVGALLLAAGVFLFVPTPLPKLADDDSGLAKGPVTNKKPGERTATGKADGEVRAGQGGAAPAGGTSAGQPGTQPPDAAKKDRPDEDPLAEITLAAIKGLLERADSEMALVQAQVWLQILLDRGVAQSDERHQALADVIGRLERKLNPPPQPDPPYVAEFATLLTRFQDALLASDLAAARGAAERAEPLFQAHPEDLARYSQRYLTLRERLRELEAEAEGALALERLLQEAEELATTGRVTEAILAQAKAKFQTQRTPLDPEEYKRIDERAKRLVPVLDRARGRRALKDAEDCYEAKDKAALDRQLDVAKARLAGLPESSIGPELAELKRASAWTITDNGASTVGQQIEFRALCETGVEEYGRGDWPALVAAGGKAHAFEQGSPVKVDPAPGAMLRGCLWETLEAKVGAAVALGDEDPELRDALGSARRMLKDAQAWNEEPVWRKLDLALTTRSAALAANEIKGARELAKRGKYAAALAALEPARPLATADLAKELDELAAQWQAELKLQADLAATDKELAQLAAQAKGGDVPGAYAGLARLRQRFPDSPRQPQMQALEEELQRSIEREVDAFLAKLEDHYRAEKWPEFRRGASQLAALPLTSRQEPLAQALIQRSEDLEHRALGILAELGPRARMLNDDDTIHVLERMRVAIDLAPDNPRIKALWEKAKGQGTRRAEKLMGSLTFLSRQPDPGPYRARLERIVALDGSGPSGQKARQLLRDLADKRATARSSR